jgi:hypothetical protein
VRTVSKKDVEVNIKATVYIKGFNLCDDIAEQSILDISEILSESFEKQEFDVSIEDYDVNGNTLIFYVTLLKSGTKITYSSTYDEPYEETGVRGLDINDRLLEKDLKAIVAEVNVTTVINSCTQFEK